MPNKKETPKPGLGRAPLRLPSVTKKPRPDPRELGRGPSKARPAGGRPPRFPGRTGGR
ncbi:hypothetical protein AIOL_000193 [Candidatus Rhodobacter oscarellae]|uniref:Uncharacterized protein n=1 Tax=Candidatus Rhodobacter oscarellae TaxID=1675527 RepID=A0A0J9H2Y3_9RHOB|nr:hypothetical protein AIOL_000193 [Candidatus Rhodobacter lobularis]